MNFWDQPVTNGTMLACLFLGVFVLTVVIYSAGHYLILEIRQAKDHIIHAIHWLGDKDQN